MVLATICVVASINGVLGWQEPQSVAIAPRDLGVFTQMVDDPANPGQQVSAQVKLTLRGELRAVPAADSALLGGRTAQVRVEAKIVEIRMDDLLERLPGVSSVSFAAILAALPKADSRAVEGVRGAVADTGSAFLRLRSTQTVDPNTNLKPGGWTIREYGIDDFKVGASYQLDREFQVGMTVWKDTLNVPQVNYGTLARLNLIPVSERFIPDPKPGDPLGEETIDVLKGWGGGAITGEGGRLEGLGFLPTLELSYPITLSAGLPQYGRDALAGILNITGKPIVSPELFGSINRQSVETLAGTTSFSGEDMNKLGYQFEPNAFPNCTGMGQSYFPPGTLWLPDKPGYQVMSNYQAFDLKMNFSPFAEVDPSAYQQGEFRTHCMNMAMKEPAKGVRYFPYRNPDPVAAGLMELTGNSRIRGPWDQARLWIYTNKAGIDAINERLMLGVSEAQYLTSLKQISGLGGLEAKDYADKKLFVPKLLAGRGMAMGTLAWGFGVLDAQQPKELGAWLSGFPEGTAKLLAGDKADKEHLSELMRHALDSGSDDVRMGALKALLKKPQGYEALKGTLGSMSMSLLSKNAGEVESALDALSAYGGSSNDAVAYLAAHGANGKIKAKATALLGG